MEIHKLRKREKTQIDLDRASLLLKLHAEVIESSRKIRANNSDFLIDEDITFTDHLGLLQDYIEDELYVIIDEETNRRQNKKKL